ncbi:MBL fold metallo-hydrolase [Bacillus sp. FJAT-49825]|uniref:MBL fold metallo-hydrolase n=1 Tax=Neobacillus rhizophilus TaxID=2833579 RepID=A0A942YW91_9BACI|nr:MBL fold metallo-hydrolase [Neobacillus rhizophilus]MBS4213795.1 MBL fold metallo-hydrolase [Neobacillus rhizophilus]
MKIQLIRHATVKINMNEYHFLVDPMFSSKGEMDPVANAANTCKNPLVELPFPIENILEGIDAVILTHSHRDHFDDAAIKTIPKDLKIFCQPEDEEKLRGFGFSNVTNIKEEENWNGIRFTRTGGQHGTGELGNQMGPVSGFIMESAGEPSLYIAGDTIWCDEVQEALKERSPEIIILNGGEAQFLTGDPITMGINDIERVSKEAPSSKIIVVHMESWNHCLLSREELRGYIAKNGLANVTVPSNGEIFGF